MSAAVLTKFAPDGSKRLLAHVSAMAGKDAVAKTPALDRLGALEIDFGVHELDPSALDLLARTVRDPGVLDTTALVVRWLPAIAPLRIPSESLRSLAAIDSSALTRVME